MNIYEYNINDNDVMAKSRNRDAAIQILDQCYGVVTDIRGKPYLIIIIVDANQKQEMLY